VQVDELRHDRELLLFYLLDTLMQTPQNCANLWKRTNSGHHEDAVRFSRARDPAGALSNQPQFTRP